MTEPADRLLEIDLADVLRARVPGARLVPASGAPADALRVMVARLRYEERPQAEARSTVSVGYNDVGTVRAALLMPRGATYLYDLVTSGAEIDYVYEVKATQGGAEVGASVLRDRARQDHRACANFRVQNVFGGVKPVDWYANDRMQADCAGGSAGTAGASMDAARKQVLEALAARVAALPPLARAAALGR